MVWAAPANTAKLVIFGHSAGGEIWQTSHWLMPAVVDDPMPANNTEAAAALDAINSLAALTTLLQGIATAYLTADCGIDGLKLYCYPAGGSVAAAQAEKAHVIVGSANVPTLPLQCALVASLKTDHAGRSARGRMYFPLPANDLAGHQVTNAVCTTLSQNLAAYMGSLKTAVITPAGNGCFAAIASGTKGSVYPITQVTVDSKVDTQRRRSMKQAATSSVTTIVAL